jgi:hypothetical protein
MIRLEPLLRFSNPVTLQPVGRTPFILETDVLVVGSRPGGLAPALAAAAQPELKRQGARIQ